MKALTLRTVVALVVLTGILAGLPGASPADAAQPARSVIPSGAGDFAIPSGWFFSEALPGRSDGVGFAVQDGHGADLWTAFESAGGVDVLGYPISRRFEWQGEIAQAFSTGSILRWDRGADKADVLGTRDLGKTPLPAYTVRPELPPIATASVSPTPWSGWWWPDFNGVGPTLFAPDSPLSKYDQYVLNVTGVNPGTRDWERQHMYFPGTSWTGHCNGFAAAALLEPEPTQPITLQGVTFSVADQKGLLVDYHFADEAAWSFGGVTPLNPADVHRMLLNWMSAAQSGLAVTFDAGGGEVWTYPAYQFASEWSPDAAENDIWHVTTTVWMADMNVGPGFIGTRPYPGAGGQTFTYDLYGDPRQPSDGVWTGASVSGHFAHPSRIWYPQSSAHHEHDDLVSPGLDRAMLDAIVAGGDTRDPPAHAGTAGGN